MKPLLISFALLWLTVGVCAQQIQIANQGISPASDQGKPRNSGLRFEDFPAKVFQKGPAKMPQFKGRDRWLRYDEEREGVLEALKSGANFAGHYAIAFNHCGTGCVYVHIVDTLNGEVFSFPPSGEQDMDMDYSVRSRLMKVIWRDEYTCIRQDLEWTGRKFVTRYEHRQKATEEVSPCPPLNDTDNTATPQ